MNIICRCGPRTSARVFAADAVDPRAKSVRSDPTGTLPIQKRFQRELDMRWDTLRRTVPNFVTARTDLASTIGHAAITGQDPVRAFQKWFDTAIKMVVVGDGRWMARFVREAGDAALMRSNSSLTRMEDAGPVDEPRDQTGKWTAGGGGSSESSLKGKSKKPVQKDDFDKAKIAIQSAYGSEHDFIEKWNEKVGIEPEEFKKTFLGGTNATMGITERGGKYEVRGTILNEAGHSVGTFNRDIDLEHKSAYSAYFKLDKNTTNQNIGKQVLGGNIEMYKQLGIEKVKVSANIDVGGYAWAKYGYVPTAAAWDDLRSNLERKITGGQSSSSSPRSRGGMEADDWDMLSGDTQDSVRDRWMDETQSEFYQSEVDSWRESGQAKDDAKRELAYQYSHDDRDVPEWAGDAFDHVRDTRTENDQSPIPYTNKQLYDAIGLEYESRRGDGEDNPDITFDDDKLKEPIGHDPNQGTLPGIEPEDLSQRLTQDMRDKIEKRLTEAFDKKAEEDADDIDPPDYLNESISEYQNDHWDSKSDREKLQHAIDYGMADIEIEPEKDKSDHEEEQPQHEMELPKATSDPLLDAVRSRDPKSIWKVADDVRGKKLLLGTGWSGVLDLKDKESMERFDKYVGKRRAA